MKFILPILHLSTLVFGDFSLYDYSYKDPDAYDPFLDYSSVEDFVYSICDTIHEQLQAALEETLKNVGVKYSLDYDGIQVAYEDNIKIAVNNDGLNFAYCFKSSNCTEYNTIKAQTYMNNTILKIQHEGTFENLGQSDVNFDSFEAITHIYMDDDYNPTYETNNNYIKLNGTTETLNAFIKIEKTGYDTGSILGGITECTSAFQDFCPFKSAKLSMEIHLDTERNEHYTFKEGSGDDNEDGSGIDNTWIRKKESYLKFVAEVDGNETPYSPIIIGTQNVMSVESDTRFIRIQIPNLIELQLAAKDFKPDSTKDYSNENHIFKMYVWATEKTEFFPFDKNLPLHLLSFGPLDAPAINNWIKTNTWSGVFYVIFIGSYGAEEAFYNSLLCLINADSLYKSAKENNGFDLSPLIKAVEFDSGLLYILGHDNYYWHDETFNSFSDINEGHLNNVLCGLAKELNKQILSNFYYIGKEAENCRRDINQELSDERYNQKFHLV